MSHVSLRPARSEDADALELVVRVAYEPWVGRLEGLPDVAAGLAEDIRTQDVWVAVDRKGKIVGGIVLSLGDEEARVVNIAVAPASAGRGIGQALLARAEDDARRSGHRCLHLATHRDMAATLRFYQRNGWDIAGREGVKVHLRKALE